ncbi:MAG: hypothetical protein ACFB14_13980 [Leptolyngbyaceae cyanobacterium]
MQQPYKNRYRRILTMQAAIQLTPIKDRAAVIEQFDKDLKA